MKLVWRIAVIVLLLGVGGLVGWTANYAVTRATQEHVLLESWFPELQKEHVILESWYQPMQDSLDKLEAQQAASDNSLFTLWLPYVEEALMKAEADHVRAVAVLQRDHSLLETWYPGMKAKLDILVSRQCAPTVPK